MVIKKVSYRKEGPHHGGLFVTAPIKKGEVAAVFDGQYCEWGDTTLNLPNDPPVFLRDHAIQYCFGKSRDSAEGLGRCANHSCSPNCGIQNYFEIVAMRDLAVGEEVMWDYAMTECNDWLMTCLCGSPRCRGLITGYRNLEPSLREEYAGFISEWLIKAEIPYEGPARMPIIEPVELFVMPLETEDGDPLARVS
jgi:hypothetical protein